MRIPILTLVVSATVAATSGRAQQTGGEECLVARVLDTLRTADGRPVFVDRPAVLREGSRMALIGYPTVVRDSGGSWTRAAAALRGDAGAFTLAAAPAGHDTLWAPRAHRAKDGIDVLWALTHARQDNRSFWLPDTIFHATWTSRGWSAARIAWSGTGTYWSGSEHSQIDDVAGGWQVAVPFRDSIGRFGVLRLRSARPTWRQQVLPLATIALYATIRAVGRDETLIGYVSNAPRGEGGTDNRVWSRRFDDVGMPLGDAHVVDPAQRGDAHMLRSLRDASGSVYLLWLEAPPDGEGAGQTAWYATQTTLRVARSSDDGRTWRMLPGLPGMRLADFDAVIDRSDAIVVLARVERGGQERLIAARLVLGAEWRSNVVASSGARGTLTAPTLSPARDGRIYATWGVAEQIGTAPLTAVTVVAVLDRCAGA